MKIKPNETYELVGTVVVLDKTKVYDAIVATNQPEHAEKGKIFVMFRPGSDDGFLLEHGEYEVVDDSANTLPECDDCSIVRGGEDCKAAECDRARAIEDDEERGDKIDLTDYTDR